MKHVHTSFLVCLLMSNSPCRPNSRSCVLPESPRPLPLEDLHGIYVCVCMSTYHMWVQSNMTSSVHRTQANMREERLLH